MEITHFQGIETQSENVCVESEITTQSSQFEISSIWLEPGENSFRFNSILSNLEYLNVDSECENKVYESENEKYWKYDNNWKF